MLQLHSTSPTPTQQLQQAPPAPATHAPLLEAPETKAEKISEEKAELKKAEEEAERPWSGEGDYGATGGNSQSQILTNLLSELTIGLTFENFCQL